MNEQQERDPWEWLREAFRVAQQAAGEVIDASKVHPHLCPDVETERIVRSVVAQLDVMLTLITGAGLPTELAGHPGEALQIALELQEELQTLTAPQVTAMVVVRDLVSLALMPAVASIQELPQYPPASAAGQRAGLILPPGLHTDEADR